MGFCGSLFNLASARALYKSLKAGETLNADDENQSLLIASSAGWE